MDMGIKNAKLDIVEVEQHGDTAIDMGQYTLSNADTMYSEDIACNTETKKWLHHQHYISGR